jgi:hypothetical protein
MNAALRALTRRGRHIPIAVLAVATVANRSIWPVTAAIIAVLGIEVLLDLHDSASADRDLEQARDLYVTGEIPHSEFERRVELILDDDAQQIRQAVEEVSGVGPETSAAIAAEFRNVEAVEQAPREDLEDVPNVGEKTAEAVVEYLRGANSDDVDAVSTADATPEARARPTTAETDGGESQQVRGDDQRGEESEGEFSAQEIQRMQELADRALDPDDDEVSLGDLEGIPRERLQDGSHGVEGGEKA